MSADLRVLSTPEHLAMVTYASVETVESFLAAPDKHLRLITVPRKGPRRPRQAWDITSEELKEAFRRLYQELDAFLRAYYPDIYPHPAVHGYLRKRSALTNAQVHAGARRLVKADVQDFFPSLRAGTVERTLLKLGFDAQGARLLTDFVTFQDSLPLGYPTSPMLSNMCCLDIDARFEVLASRYAAKYTRYADDLTFSGSGDMPGRAEIQDVLSGIGLTLRADKFRMKRQGQALYVTGYSISDAVPRAPRALKRRLRQSLYFAERFGLRDHAERRGARSLMAEYSQISGWIELVRKAEPELGEQLRARWRAIPLDDFSTHSLRPARPPEPVTLLIDDTEFSAHGTSYRGLGIVSLHQPDWSRQRLKELSALFLLDSTMPESARERVRQQGIHFAYLPEDFRARAIAVVARTTRLRAHIVYAEKQGEKKEQLKSLIASSLKYRLSDQRGKLVTVVFEQGEYVTTMTAPGIIETAASSLDERERPLRIEDVRVVSKLQEPCLALADVILGVWKNYAVSNEPTRANRAERDRLLFDTLRPKIATVYNASNAQLYTSGRPFQPFPAPLINLQTEPLPGP